MSLSLSLSVSGDALPAIRKLRASAGKSRAAMYDAILPTVRRQAQLAAGHVVRTQLSGRPGRSFPERPAKAMKRRRTGSLARSISGRVIDVGGLPAIQVGLWKGPASPYASIQELGTQGINPNSPYPAIKPKNAKALAVPVGPALTPAGVARYEGPRQFPEPLKLLSFGRGVGKNKNVVGRLVLEKEYREARERAAINNTQPDFSSLETIYLLLSHMNIAPGFFVTDGMQDYLPTFAEAVATALVKELKS